MPPMPALILTRRAARPALLAVAVGALALWLAPLLAAPAWAEGGLAPIEPQLNKMIRSGGVAVGQPDGPPLLYREGSYIPASIIKLATAQTALAELGPEYRFKTAFYLRDGVLYIKGYGDPFLISEEWAVIATRLKQAGLLDKPIQAIVADDSAFEEGLEVDGRNASSNPYDARPGALAANFNTVNVVVGPGGQVASAEPQTPLTPLARQRASRLGRGKQRVSFSTRRDDGPLYAGQLAAAFILAQGGRVEGPVRRGKAPAGKPDYLHHSTRPLTQVISGMLEFSNNYIANQLVLVLALESRGEPARLETGVERVRLYLSQKLALSPQDFTLVEGSGLSRQNRITLSAMLKVVEGFYPWRNLLSPYGFNGKKTAGGPPPALAKTGTLTGVYTLAGYLPAQNGSPRPFVILLNQPRNNRHQVFQALYSQLANP